MRYCAPNDSTVIQRAAAAALTGPQDCVVEMRQIYQHRRDLAVSLLKDLGRYIYSHMEHSTSWLMFAAQTEQSVKDDGSLLISSANAMWL